VKVTKTSAKKGNKPAKRAAVETVKALSGRKLIAAVAAEAGKYRPDLKVCCVPALGTAQSAIHFPCEASVLASLVIKSDAHSLNACASDALLCIVSAPLCSQDAAIRRASAIQKSLRVKKAAGKSTGSQALTVA